MSGTAKTFDANLGGVRVGEGGTAPGSWSPTLPVETGARRARLPGRSSTTRKELRRRVAPSVHGGGSNGHSPAPLKDGLSSFANAKTRRGGERPSRVCNPVALPRPIDTPRPGLGRGNLQGAMTGTSDYPRAFDSQTVHPSSAGLTHDSGDGASRSRPDARASSVASPGVPSESRGSARAHA